MKTGMIIAIVVIILLALFITRCSCKHSEQFCAVAPRFDYYYQANRGYPQGPSSFPAGYQPGAGRCNPEIVNVGNCGDNQGCSSNFKLELAQDEFMDEDINKLMGKSKTLGVQGRDYKGRMLHENQPIRSNYDGFNNMRFEGFKNGVEGDAYDQYTQTPPPPKIGALSMGPTSLPGTCGCPGKMKTSNGDIVNITAPQCPNYSDMAVCNPLYRENGGPYSNFLAKSGVIANADTVGSPFSEGCRSCGGEAISTSPKRDFYYQPESGFLGTGLFNGYPFYKAI